MINKQTHQIAKILGLKKVQLNKFGEIGVGGFSWTDDGTNWNRTSELCVVKIEKSEESDRYGDLDALYADLCQKVSALKYVYKTKFFNFLEISIINENSTGSNPFDLKDHRIFFTVILSANKMHHLYSVDDQEIIAQKIYEFLESLTMAVKDFVKSVETLAPSVTVSVTNNFKIHSPTK